MKFLFLCVALSCTGCMALRPDYLTAGYVHQSQPMQGKGPPPFGDHGRTEESDFDGIEAGARWERGQFYYEGDLTYLLREGGHEPGNWFVTVRAGAKVAL